MSAGRRARQRGKRGEREVVKILKEAGYNAKRGYQSYGASQPDVVTDLPFWIECKYCERLNIYDALKQAETDKTKVDNMRNMPHLVAFRKNGHPWCVALTLEEFLKLCQNHKSLSVSTESLLPSSGISSSPHGLHPMQM